MIPGNVRKGKYVRLNSSHLTWESMRTIIGCVCPIVSTELSRVHFNKLKQVYIHIANITLPI